MTAVSRSQHGRVEHSRNCPRRCVLRGNYTCKIETRKLLERKWNASIHYVLLMFYYSKDTKFFGEKTNIVEELLCIFYLNRCHVSDEAMKQTWICHICGKSAKKCVLSLIKYSKYLNNINCIIKEYLLYTCLGCWQLYDTLSTLLYQEYFENWNLKDRQRSNDRPILGWMKVVTIKMRNTKYR